MEFFAQCLISFFFFSLGAFLTYEAKGSILERIKLGTISGCKAVLYLAIIPLILSVLSGSFLSLLGSIMFLAYVLLFVIGLILLGSVTVGGSIYILYFFKKHK